MNDEEIPEPPSVADLVVDPAVTRELFEAWRSPRFGTGNPTRMNNPVWEWLIRTGATAYVAAEKFEYKPAEDAGPGWCFQRFGQTDTQLPDGRRIVIGGEHEDWYDPDFHIYNDVVVLHPNGAIDIWGYTASTFPPTDFHTATLVGNRIVIIGCLGYSEKRQPGTTPVRVLDLQTFAITTQRTTGHAPGWIHRHEAVLEPDGKSIRVCRGKLDRGEPDDPLADNIDDWRLHLDGWRWERLTDRRWPRWVVTRSDGRLNSLWQFHLALFYRSMGLSEQLQEEVTRLGQLLGHPPDLDTAERLFRPDIPFETVPGEPEEAGSARIRVDGVLVRYANEGYGIHVTAEGDLPAATLTALQADLATKLEKIEQSPVLTKRL